MHSLDPLIKQSGVLFKAGTRFYKLEDSVLPTSCQDNGILRRIDTHVPTHPVALPRKTLSEQQADCVAPTSSELCCRRSSSHRLPLFSNHTVLLDKAIRILRDQSLKNHTPSDEYRSIRRVRNCRMRHRPAPVVHACRCRPLRHSSAYTMLVPTLDNQCSTVHQNQ